MTRTTAILNLKGGVGKTTTVINLAALLAKEHKAKVLVIDGDSQCNTTEFFHGRPDDGNLAHILRNSRYFDDPEKRVVQFIQNTKYENIDLIPADETLMDMDLSKVEQGTISSNVLRYLVNEVKDRYTHILIDCPPAFNAASAAALIAADDVIIPIKLDAFSVRGMVNLMRQVKNMRQINPRLKVAGLLPTMWYPDDEIVDAENHLKAAGLNVFHHIRRSDKVDKMTFRQDPLLITSPKSAAGVDYRKFVAQYVRGC